MNHRVDTRWDRQPGTSVGYCPSTASFSVRPYCKNARRDRCPEYHNCFPFGELEETTRSSSWMKTIQQDLRSNKGDNCGSESSTLETDVCVWRYAPLVVLATQEEEDTIEGFNVDSRAVRDQFNLAYTARNEKV